jgi:hypothetical protein
MQVIRTHVRAAWEAVLIRTRVRATVNLTCPRGLAGARFVPKPGALGGPLARAIVRPAAASDVPPRGPGHRAVARQRPAPRRPAPRRPAPRRPAPRRPARRRPARRRPARRRPGRRLPGEPVPRQATAGARGVAPGCRAGVGRPVVARYAPARRPGLPARVVRRVREWPWRTFGVRAACGSRFLAFRTKAG